MINKQTTLAARLYTFGMHGVDVVDMCAKFESIRRRTVKWTTVYFEHLVDLMFLNTYVIANYWYTKEREEELKTEGKRNEKSKVYNLNRHVFQRTLGSLLIKPWSDKMELNKSNAVYNTLGFKLQNMEVPVCLVHNLNYFKY